MKIAITTVLTALLCAAAMGTPASAQVRPPPAASSAPPGISLRPFFVLTEERFTAHQTFEAIFGQSFQPFWGGGLNVMFSKGFYFDVAASRFRKTGERAFFFDGEGFGLGIPLTVTVTPLEVTVGQRTQLTPRVFPYLGFGVGSYRYQEASDFDDGDFDERHIGYLIAGGVEVRVSRWVALGGDAQYTYVKGIIGNGGVSKETGETDLGGIAGRFRVIVGR